MNVHKFKKAIDQLKKSVEVTEQRYWQLEGFAKAQEENGDLTLQSSLEAEKIQLMTDLRRHIKTLENL